MDMARGYEIVLYISSINEYTNWIFKTNLMYHYVKVIKSCFLMKIEQWKCIFPSILVQTLEFPAQLHLILG